MRKFQENRVRNGEVIRVFDRHTARHLFRSSHLNSTKNQEPGNKM